MMDFYQDLWNQTLEILRKSFDETTFENTFSNVKKVVKEVKGVIHVLTPNPYTKTLINNLYSLRIADILSTLTDKRLKFKFVCADEVQEQTPKSIHIAKHNLNNNFTFESLVVGEANRIAVEFSMKVSRQPGGIANPLYIYGGVGLGKTHLMQAIGNYILEDNLETNILYVQATDFITDYTRSIQSHNMQPFIEKYENLDVLLVDDIQMLEGKTGSQQEFFKLFNDMIMNNKQVVITSDRLPQQLKDIMDRLTSRFQKGMFANIRHPELALRVEILKRKLIENTDKTLDINILNYIAENFTDNVRELEGALNRVLWYSEVYNTTPTLELAKESLEVLINSKKPSNDSYDNALSVIAATYQISTADLVGKSRNSKYVLPRHIAMYILKNNFGLTYAKIGSILNGRDHSTVMSGCTKIEEEIKTNQQLKMAIDSILKKV